MRPVFTHNDGYIARVVLVPKLGLGTPFLEAPASHRIPEEPSLGSCSFQDCIPKLELGNEKKARQPFQAVDTRQKDKGRCVYD